MEILKLAPSVHGRIWGGDILTGVYGFEAKNIKDGEKPGEAWMLSCHKDGASFVKNGIYEGLTLAEVIEKEGKTVLGTHNENIADFPVLIKIIDAGDKLSVQVHPGDEYARRVENENGKTEAWYILSAEPGAGLVYGVNKQMTREAFAESIEDGTLMDNLQFRQVKAGDVVFIPSGMLHAIGKGILLAEVQQSSNTTYRVFDYNRLQKDGTLRKLDVKKATDVVALDVPVADFSPKGEAVKTGDGRKTYLTGCDYFKMTLAEIDGEMKDVADETCFVSLLILEGSGYIESAGQSLSLKKGDSVFIPAGKGDYILRGTLKILETRT